MGLHSDESDLSFLVYVFIWFGVFKTILFCLICLGCWYYFILDCDLNIFSCITCVYVFDIVEVSMLTISSTIRMRGFNSIKWETWRIPSEWCDFISGDKFWMKLLILLDSGEIHLNKIFFFVIPTLIPAILSANNQTLFYKVRVSTVWRC